MKFWTKAFWKDAFERVTATAIESLLGIMIATGFDLSNLLSWSGVWKSVTAVTLVALLKTLLAGLKNPNSGASFGTAIPADLVHAMETQLTVEAKTEGGIVGPESKPGDIVAGPGATQPTDSPVVVKSPPLPPPAT